MKTITIAIEDLATVFISEFAKSNKSLFSYDVGLGICGDQRRKFLKMNYSRRKKLVEKVLDKMEKESSAKG